MLASKHARPHLRSVFSVAATASALLYAANALAVGQKVNLARFVSSWGRYAALAGLLAVTAAEA